MANFNVGVSWSEAGQPTFADKTTGEEHLTLEAGGCLRPGALPTGSVFRALQEVIFVDLPDTAGDIDIPMPEKVRVIDFSVQKTTNGGSGDTVQLKNVTTAITDVISLNINTKVLARAAQIDEAQAVIAKGANLRITQAKATNCSGKARITVVRVA